MAGQMLFVIVGYQDQPLYEATFGQTRPADQSQNDGKQRSPQLQQFVLHASLDALEDQIWTTNSHYLKAVDRYGSSVVSAYCTTSMIKFLLLHDAKQDDSIKLFFQEVYEVYLRISLNPFHTPVTPIKSPQFNDKVRALAKRYLGHG